MSIFLGNHGSNNQQVTMENRVFWGSSDSMGNQEIENITTTIMKNIINSIKSCLFLVFMPHYRTVT